MKQHWDMVVVASLIAVRIVEIVAMVLIGLSLGGADAAASEISPEFHPPVQFLPLNEIEPPHDVPAKEWNAPYCLQWRDRYTECSRFSLQAAGTCRSTRTGESESGKSFSFCQLEDRRVLNKMCAAIAFFKFHWLEFDKSVETADFFLHRHAQGYLTEAWEYVRGRWIFFQNDLLGNPEWPERAVLALPAIEGIGCVADYAKSSDWVKRRQNITEGH